MRRVSTRVAIGSLGLATVVLGAVALRPHPDAICRPPAIKQPDSMPALSGYFRDWSVLPGNPGESDYVIIHLWRVDDRGQFFQAAVILKYDGRTMTGPQPGQAAMFFSDGGTYAGWLPVADISEEANENAIQEWGARWLRELLPEG